MILWIKEMYVKFEETISYLIFGFLAFVVNMAAYYVAAKVLGANNENVTLVLAATGFAWVVAVLFAFWTNRTFVFKSKTSGTAVGREFLSFVGARIATGLMEMALMYGMVQMINIDNMIAKFICNVFVIVTNYIFSKLWVFRKKV